LTLAGGGNNGGGLDVNGPAANENFFEGQDVLSISPYAAQLNVTVGGNLNLVGSQIINEGIAGNINLAVGGKIDVGNGIDSVGQNLGIFTTSGGNVSVTANGDINVDGSRIATYGGGNIDVVSKTGDVNAGNGGQGGLYVWLAYLNSDGTITDTRQFVSGSGILESVAKDSPAIVGNITVEAPEGSINASSGGIAQLAFNGKHDSSTFISLDAGKDINAANSGVIGYNLKLKAGGSINGLFIGAGNVSVSAGQNFGGTLIGSGSVTVNAGGTISGSIVGGGDISASGGTITATLISSSVSASGNTAGAAEGLPTGGIAKEVLPDNTSSSANNADQSTDDWRKKKKATLGQPAGQVTVVLPKI